MDNFIRIFGYATLALWLSGLVFFTIVYIVRGDDPEWEDR
jgi:hypothetical protein